jgi:hypothetical protein
VLYRAVEVGRVASHLEVRRDRSLNLSGTETGR